MNNNLISVVIPIYNTGVYLSECIDSVIASTYENLDIILIDDGSTDESSSIADEYMHKDKRIRVIHKTNNGVSSARNTGIEMAYGDWIAFIDSDDTICSNYFEVLLKNAIDNNADISFGISNIIDEFGNKIKVTDEKTIIKCLNMNEGIQHLLEAREFGCAMNKLYNATLWRNYRIPEDIHINEDLLANFFVFQNSNNIVYTNAKLYNYRERIGSASRSGFTKKQFDIVKVNRIITEYCRLYIKNESIYLSAEKRYLGTLISIYKGVVVSGYTEIEKSLVKEARKNKLHMIKNNYFTCIKKLEFFTLCYFTCFYKIMIKLQNTLYK